MITSLLLAASIAASPAPSGCTLCASLHGLSHQMSPALQASIAQLQETPPTVTDPEHQKEIDGDIALGKEIADQVRKEMKLSQSQPIIDRVRRIGAEISIIANKEHVLAPWGDKRFSPFQYGFEVLEGDEINAFSLPGGQIFVFEGLVKYAETDHELAGVLAHEVAHAAFRHVATLQRQSSRMQSVTLPLILISLLAGGDAGQKVAIGANLLERAVGSGWSVQAEKAADFGGFEYMRRSSFNPVGLLTFMERLAYDERNQPSVDWGIFRTHPPSQDRARAIYSNLILNGLPIQRSVSSTTFRAIALQEVDESHTVKFLGRKIVNFKGEGAEARSTKVAENISRFFDTVPRVFEVEKGSNGEIVGRGQVLLTVKESDAAAAGKDLATYTETIIRELKSAVFEISYRTLAKD